jgi:hypothetical protein
MRFMSSSAACMQASKSAAQGGIQERKERGIIQMPKGMTALEIAITGILIKKAATEK